jgi:hypothetical protein
MMTNITSKIPARLFEGVSSVLFGLRYADSMERRMDCAVLAEVAWCSQKEESRKPGLSILVRAGGKILGMGEFTLGKEGEGAKVTPLQIIHGLKGLFCGRKRCRNRIMQS